MTKSTLCGRLLFSLLLAVIVFSPNFFAVAAPSIGTDIYSADVELADGTSTARQDAFKQALAKVLIKLSGTREILEEPASGKIIEDAPRYVQSYRKNKASESTFPDLSSNPAGNTILHVDFDGPALERALVAVGLPVWSGTRPSTLVWLAVEDSQRRYILAENSKSVVLPILQQAAAERGLPIIIPLMDQTDRQQVEYIDIRGGFGSRLQQATERYNVPIILVGALQSSGSSGWTVKWTVMCESISSSWVESNLPLAQVMRSGIDGLADILSSRYAFVSTPGGQLSEYVLAVDQVTTLQHYAIVLSILQKLVFVESVTSIRAKGSQVYYRVSMHGQLQELARALALAKQLQELDVVPRTDVVPTNPDHAETGGIPDRYKTDLYFTFNP
ncbi:MAG: DUF2066 domain-containing protein [Gammaproteobacteria bacterium]|nr:DUF2066 domain-containing protein [Gammaproteobacteria bacterium]